MLLHAYLAIEISGLFTALAAAFAVSLHMHAWKRR